jgi:hypothetical protein
MSDKIQRNSETLREQMLHHYKADHHHKHDKNHRPYRLHARTHPNLTPNYLNQLDYENKENYTKKWSKEFKLRKIRKRYDRGGFVH